MSEEKSGRFNDIATSIGTVISIFTAIVVAFIAARNQELEELKTERELAFRVFDTALNAVKENDESTLNHLEDLVKEVPEIEESYKNELLGLIDKMQDELSARLDNSPQISQASSVSEDDGGVKDQIPFSSPSSPQSQKPETLEEWSKWNYDIFSCELPEDRSDSQGANPQSTANSIALTLQESGLFTGRIRARVLPDSRRFDPSFGAVQPYQIRIDKGGDEMKYEPDITKKLKELTGIKDDFDVFEINPASPTPNYVSIFICPDI